MAWDALTDDVGGDDDQQIVPSLVLAKISNNDWSYFSTLVKFLIYQNREGRMDFEPQIFGTEF
jgi:hypothetical protein